MKTHSLPLAVHQYHDSVSPGDAVTQQMLFIQRSLKEVGVEGKIFCRQMKGMPLNWAYPFELESAWNCDLLLIHHSQGSPSLGEVLRVERPKGLVYHNITPPQFFSHDDYLASLSKRGRAQLTDFLGKVEIVYAVSKFNASELKSIGFSKIRSLPLLDLSGKESPPTKPQRVPEAPKTLLFVGRLSAHKNQALLLRTFYHLKPSWPKGSRLVLVGGEDPVYGRYLRLLTRQLGLSGSVIFPGKVTGPQLEKYYRAADAFACVSQHEGFCVPLVEAMAYGLPIFYLPHAAVPETMGASGISLQTSDPVEIAQAIQTTLNQNGILKLVLEGQNRRFQELKVFQNAERVCREILPLCEKHRIQDPSLSFNSIILKKPIHVAKPAH